MASRSQAITWKVMGIPKDKRRCSVCHEPIVLSAPGGLDFMESRLDSDGVVMVRHAYCKPERRAA
jgi:hypothetical protein